MPLKSLLLHYFEARTCKTFKVQVTEGIYLAPPPENVRTVSDFSQNPWLKSCAGSECIMKLTSMQIVIRKGKTLIPKMQVRIQSCYIKYVVYNHECKVTNQICISENYAVVEFMNITFDSKLTSYKYVRDAWWLALDEFSESSPGCKQNRRFLLKLSIT